jgi:NAD+ diphosphatase
LLSRQRRPKRRRRPRTGLGRIAHALQRARGRHFALAGRAIQLLDWDRSHRYCGRCGTPTEAKAEERARVCPACKLSAYPRIAPAVMALVRREGEILLGRSPHFPPGMYSALAGFVEPGETLEQCLAREVEEEVGVQVSRIRYFASQPWPFPNSLMIAFVCDWSGGEIRPQAGEIEDAKWFNVLQLPKLPSRISIARRLIEAVVNEMRADEGHKKN